MPIQLPLFANESPEFAGCLRPKLRSLTDQGIFFGTSSWKYPGWIGQIYSPDRYTTRGKFSQSKFDADCLKEYAETFPVVCGDFSFYQFPSPQFWKRLFGETPTSLKFAFKVPEEITVGVLDPDLFQTSFAKPLLPYRDRVACLIFEFGTFPKKTFAQPAAFLARLDRFLASLPGEFRYSIEIRNSEYLGLPYFDTLASHHVAHVFNAWTRMPEIAEQIALPGAFTTNFTVARALLRQGRSYEQAVAALEPYASIQEPNFPVREGLSTLVKRGLLRRDPTFLFINNRLEGNAPGTIAAVIAEVDRAHE
jgi:uncharacterized protein YecE (DUF72 family)